MIMKSSRLDVWLLNEYLMFISMGAWVC